ncbi:MAG: TlyA family RNA methyltransferase [Actinomycetota bacterium]|nr:TlyA family RNA methyltransferase [Actinomycetota bacterium]
MCDPPHTFGSLHPAQVRSGATVRGMPRQRLDTLLAERGAFSSRTAAAAAVRAGEVQLGHDGPFALRPSQLVEPEADLIVAEGPRYVSRGGIKLQNALEAFGIDVAGRDCLDVGASTGGFTDCLLQYGAARVTAIDVAHGELDWRLRNDPRVTVIERLNARSLEPADLPFAPSLAAIDVSFIGLTKVLPAVAGTVSEDGEVLALVKPQFELGREKVGKGVVRDPALRRAALALVAEAAGSLGLAVRGIASSGLAGPKGNRESFLWCSREGESLGDVEAAIDEVES